MKRIAVAGGIGAGKSVVSRILRTMGYPVYDSDREARLLMDASEEIKDFLRREIHAEAIAADGCIDRRLVGRVVFSDESKRKLLNSAVHSAVRSHFTKWCSAHDSSPLVFVECAILCESGLVDYVDEVWEIVAPTEVRVRRVQGRDKLSVEEILDRIQSQQAESDAMQRVKRITITNDGLTPLLPQIENALL